MRKAGAPMSDDMGYPTDEQVNQLIDAANSSRNKLFIIMLSKTGRRVGELIRLKPCDINYENNTISWHIEKKYKVIKDEETGNIKRYEKIHLYKAIKTDKKTLEILRKYIAYYNVENNDKIFNFNRHRAYQIVRRIGELAGILTIGSKRLHPHHFRHYYAMKLAETSRTPTDISIIKDQLQHSDINTTIQYFKMSGKRKEELLERAFS